MNKLTSAGMPGPGNTIEPLSALLGLALLVLVPGLLGCNKGGSSPAAPTSLTTTPPTVASLSLTGTVSDTAFRPVGGATIEVLDGPQAGLSTTTDGAGTFSLTGLFDESTRFRATKSGHATAITTLQRSCGSCPPSWITFTLEVTAPPVDMGGDYTLRFVANSACTMLPDEMRSRTFTGTIPATVIATHADAYFRVGGATFFEDWDTIAIGVAGDYVAFWLETLVERVAPNAFLAFDGQAAQSVGTSSASTLVLPFSGSIAYCVTTAQNGRYEDCYQGRAAVRRCHSTHQLTLTRR